MIRHPIYVGSAGWAIPRQYAERFGPGASHLSRYATRFRCAEINSSFYRPHKPATYARWATSTPATFRFSVKAPREVTHRRRLIDVTEMLDRFALEAGELGAKLGPILVQLPPSLAYDHGIAARFWRELRQRFRGPIVCEPRHPSWFGDDAGQLLATLKVGRVAADPPPAPMADQPAGWPGIRYFRLHGSPRIYYDAYNDPYLDRLAARLVELAHDAPVWCVFDNTAEGAATSNALALIERLRARSAHP